MTTPVPTHHHDGLITRRSIFIGAAASLICAPAIVRVTSLMPVRRVPPPFGPQYAGFVDVYIMMPSTGACDGRCKKVA